jgi:hypothetical protein
MIFSAESIRPLFTAFMCSCIHFIALLLMIAVAACISFDAMAQVTGINSINGESLVIGAGGTQYMWILPPNDTSGNPLPATACKGCIGIGLTNPAKILDVNKGATIGGGIVIDGTNDSRITIGQGMSTVWSWSNGWATPGDFSLIQEGVSGSVIYVKPGGKVGLGTTNPLGTLDVENGAGTAEICLNGSCTTSLGSVGHVFGGAYTNQCGWGCVPTNFVNPYTGGYNCPSWAPNVRQGPMSVTYDCSKWSGCPTYYCTD